MKPHRKIGRLIVKYNKQTLTEEEGRKLNEWLQQSEANRILFKHLTNKKYAAKLWAINTEEVRRKIARQPEKAIIRKMRIQKGVFIATIIIAITCSVVFFFSSRRNTPAEAISERSFSNEVSSTDFLFKDSIDMVPGNHNAILVLSTGATLNLGKMPIGTYTTVGNNNFFKKDSGLVTVTCDSITNQANGFNTIIVPKGGQFEIKLSDGSVASLNAASSLIFPTIFDPTEREVALEGEAYFKVNELLSPEERHKKIPFVVDAGNTNVRVTGTQFNINAYKDEKVVKTTLVNGRVEVNEKVMFPNQTALVDEKGKTQIFEVDVNDAIAWRSNRFIFKNTPLEQVMRQLSRWYNKEVVFKTKIDKYITLNISRDKTIVKVLEILEDIGDVKFSINGNEIIVTK